MPQRGQIVPQSALRNWQRQLVERIDGSLEGIPGLVVDVSETPS